MHLHPGNHGLIPSHILLLATAGLRIGIAKAGSLHSYKSNPFFLLNIYSRERILMKMRTSNSFRITKFQSRPGVSKELIAMCHNIVYPVVP
jgi:hypothetical protein